MPRKTTKKTATKNSQAKIKTKPKAQPKRRKVLPKTTVAIKPKPVEPEIESEPEPEIRFQLAKIAVFFCVVDTGLAERPFVWRMRPDGAPATADRLVRLFDTVADAKAFRDVLNNWDLRMQKEAVENGKA